MADFEEALNSLLSNPDAMGQILSLAGSLGGQTQEASAREESASQPAPPEPSLSLPDLGQIGRLMELFQSATQTNEEAAALLAALRPFLREDRQRKLDRAIKAAGMSHAARQALRLWKEGELHL